MGLSVVCPPLRVMITYYKESIVRSFVHASSLAPAHGLCLLRGRQMVDPAQRG